MTFLVTDHAAKRWRSRFGGEQGELCRALRDGRRLGKSQARRLIPTSPLRRGQLSRRRARVVTVMRLELH